MPYSNKLGAKKRNLPVKLLLASTFLMPLKIPYGLTSTEAKRNATGFN